MSHYQMFQGWWEKATGGPSNFYINKRSAEIGFNAALDLVEQNSDSPASPVQQLKAKISALVTKFETPEGVEIQPNSLKWLVEQLQKLSAV